MRRSAREIYRDVKAEDAPTTIERMLKAYLAHRASRDESFQAFARRHEIEALKPMFARRRPHELAAAARRSPTILPENAPFTAEQRDWLNGFFAGAA